MTINDKVLRGVIARLEKLERRVFRSGKQVANKGDSDTKKYKGATGGIRLLVDEGFFDKKRSFGEVCKALENKDYHYSKQAVQTPLNTLSKAGSLLVSFREGGRKVYAKRK